MQTAPTENPGRGCELWRGRIAASCQMAEVADPDSGELDRTGRCSAQTAGAAQPHHGALNLARPVHRDLNELPGLGIAVIWLALGALDFQGFGNLGRGKFDDNALLPEVGENLTAYEEAVFAINFFSGDVFPGAKPLNNGRKWSHVAGESTRSDPSRRAPSSIASQHDWAPDPHCVDGGHPRAISSAGLFPPEHVLKDEPHHLRILIQAAPEVLDRLTP